MGDADPCSWLPALAGYALGALEEPERGGLAEHLRLHCPWCEAELRRLDGEVQALAESAPWVMPLQDTREWLLAQVRPPPWWARRRLLVAGVAAALALASCGLGWGALAWRRLSAVEGEYARLASALLASETRVVAAERREEGCQRAMSLLGGGAHLQQARLAGALSAPHATGTTLVDPRRRRGVFAAAGLPPVAADRTYQLWVVTASGALPAGTFVPAADGTVAVAVSDLPAGEAIAGWAVSSEPGGGSESPSGPVLLSSTAGGR